MVSVSWKRAKEHGTLVKNLRGFNQGILLLGAGLAGERVK